MTTLMTPARTVKTSRRPAFSAELLSAAVRINGQVYNLEPIPAGECGTVACRLTKAGSDAVYDVVRTHDGFVECDCPDYESRHRGNGFGMCKHGRALVELGMVPAPKASTVETPKPTPAVTKPVRANLPEQAPELVPAAIVEAPAPAPVLDAPQVEAEPVLSSRLPAIDGHGLSQAEFLRMNRCRNIARFEYARDCPEASPGELDRVADAAARDELRRLLRDRPAASDPEPAAVDAPCCSASEAVPCVACVAVPLPDGVARLGDVLADVVAVAPLALAVAIDPWDVEADPSEWPDDTDNFYWNTSNDDQVEVDEHREPAELLTLDQHIDREAARLRRMETHAGDLMAKTLADLASTVRFLHAATPGDYEARVEVMERTERNEPTKPAPGLIPRDLAERLMATSLVGHDDF